MPDPPSHSFRDLAGLAAWARRLLWLQAALSALAVILALAHGPGFADETGSAAYLVLALIQAVVFVPAGVVVLRWIYFATANAHALGAQSLSSGPVMSVVWYFIPIANLVMPFQTMREVFKAARDPRDWEVVRAPAILGGWWFFWLTSNAAGTAAFRLALDPSEPEAPAWSETLTLASDLLNIPASLLLAIIVTRITVMQTAVARRAGQSQPTPPPTSQMSRPSWG